MQKEINKKEIEQSAFNIIDNVYYVGTDFVSCHLITTNEGHILIDTGLPEDGETILKKVKELGFDIRDIKYIFITHAHFDHVGSAKYIQEKTEAKIYIGKEDIPIAEQKNIMKYDRYGKRTNKDLTETVLKNKEKYFMNFEKIKIDEVFVDNGVFKLGNIEIKTFHTPGHSVGSYSFSFQVEKEGVKYNVYLPGGIGINVFRDDILEDNIFGGNIKDYINSVKALKDEKVDIWLGAHPFFNDTFEKRILFLKDGGNPFNDIEGGKKKIDEWLDEAKNQKL